VVETGDRVRDGAGESVGVSESAVGELMLLEVAPASFDVVQLRGVFRQPFEGQPGARGKRLCCQLAGVDRPVVENRDQRPVAFGDAVGGAKLVEQIDKVGGALGGAGVHQKAPTHRIEGPEHRLFLCLPGCFDAQVRSAPGPAARQIGMRERLGFVEKHQIDRSRCGLGFQIGKVLAAGLDRRCVLAPFEGVRRATKDKPL
jgi:hypothetical protein